MKRLGRGAPPAHDDADIDWRSARFCVIDVETTGLDLRRDEIVSIGSATIADGRVSCRSNSYLLVRPARDSCVGAIQVHGLRPSDMTCGVDPGDAARAVCDQLRGAILVAHAAWIERAFLGRLLRGGGLALTAQTIDTAALARSAGLAPSATTYEPSLEGLAVRLGLPVYTPHHALGDALTTATVFLALAARFEAAAPSRTVTVRDLLYASDQHSS